MFFRHTAGFDCFLCFRLAIPAHILDALMLLVASRNLPFLQQWQADIGLRLQELEMHRQRLVALHPTVGLAEQAQIEQQLGTIRQRQQYMQQQYSMAAGPGGAHEQRGAGAYGHPDAAAYEVRA